MSFSRTDFPSIESLNAWAKGGEQEAMTFKQGRKFVTCILKVKRTEGFYYFEAKNGEFRLLATSSKDIFAQEKADE